MVDFDEQAFGAAIDQYIDQGTEEELGFVMDSTNEKELTEALEYFLFNQLDESFGVEELDELKKFLTAEEIERLENEPSLATFEQLLTRYYNEREQKLEEGTAFSAFFLASTDEEIYRMLEANDEQTFAQVISEIRDSRNSQASGKRQKRFLPIAVQLLVKGAAVVIGLGTAAYSSYKVYTTLSARRAEKKRMVERWRYHEQQAQKRYQAAQQARAKAVARARQQAAACARAQAAASARRKSNASYVPPVTRPKPVIKVKPKAPAKPVVKPVAKPGPKSTTPTKSKPATPKNTTHQVRAGESVWSISHKYGISMNDFAQWNKIKNNTIHPGQVMHLKEPTPVSKPTPKPTPKPTTNITYTVKAGDSVWLRICMVLA